MHGKGLARTPSCHQIHIGLWDNKERVVTFRVPTSVAGYSGPLGCVAGLIISPIFMSKARVLENPIKIVFGT